MASFIIRKNLTEFLILGKLRYGNALYNHNFLTKTAVAKIKKCSGKFCIAKKHSRKQCFISQLVTSIRNKQSMENIQWLFRKLNKKHGHTCFCYMLKVLFIIGCACLVTSSFYFVQSHAQNIASLFLVFVQYPFTTSERDL